MFLKKLLTGISIVGIGFSIDPLSVKFGVQDMCAYEIIDCSQAAYSSCDIIYDEYCSCIRSDLTMDVAILLDASNSIQTSQYWHDLTIKIANGFGSQLQSRETGIDSSVFVFGDNQVNQYDYNIDISFPNYSSGSVCNALNSAASYLSSSSDNNKIIIYIAWGSPDVSSCNFDGLAGIKLYVVAIPPNLNLNALQSGATAAGAQVTVVNYCNDQNCLIGLQTANTAQETAKLIVSFIGDWICSVYTVAPPTPSPTFLQPPQGFPAPSPTSPPQQITPSPTFPAPTTPSPIIPPQQVTPPPTKQWWSWSTSSPTTPSPTTPAPTTPSPTTPAPTTPSPTTPAPITPSPIIPPQQITPSPTSKRWSWSTSIVPPQQITPSPTPAPTSAPSWWKENNGNGNTAGSSHSRGNGKRNGKK